MLTKSKLLAVGFSLLLLSSSADAFCGFYVARADATLYNKSSQVVIVRDENRTVITMANDYQGNLKEFAVVIPVPTFVTEKQIHVTERKILEHLDSYSAPRLVEYFDENPCNLAKYKNEIMRSAIIGDSYFNYEEDKITYGVTVEAEYTVGEYDIVILSAKESDGLVRWLTDNKYNIPKGASKVLEGYIKQGTHFFVAKVNIEKQSKLGFKFLRPIQVAFNSPKFMLPIRLGMLNADGDQELLIYILTKNGRVETTNYRTVKLPSNVDIPVYVKDDFGKFYNDMFTRQVEKQNKKAVFLEYAWNMSWCDPCADNPLSTKELKELGVFWLGDKVNRSRAQQVYITRLHLRYNNETFPEDLIFQHTGDASNFQGRYVIRHPWMGKNNCQQAERYRVNLTKRLEKEAQTLASLTGWDINMIRSKIDLPPLDNNWWNKLWNE